MTVKYSLDLSTSIKPCQNKVCKSCGLYLNQMPVTNKANKSHIFWVGLSAVQFDDNIERQPLSPNTRSGALIENVEIPLKNHISFYKTNLVKCLPLKNGKIRYPVEQEMEKCFPNFEMELEILNPAIVFLLGKQVATFVMRKFDIKNLTFSDSFNYECFMVDNITFIPVHHPSYILVYKRRFLNQYINSLQECCNNIYEVID